jgi:hypothetical protein
VPLRSVVAIGLTFKESGAPEKSVENGCFAIINLNDGAWEWTAHNAQSVHAGMAVCVETSRLALCLAIAAQRRCRQLRSIGI